MISILKETVKKMDPASMKIIYHGLQLAVGVMVIGYIMYFLNQYTNDPFAVLSDGETLVQTAVSIVAQCVLVGFISNYFLKNNK